MEIEEIVPQREISVLLDVDNTVVTLNGEYNSNLFKVLQLFDIRHVSFLTRMDITAEPSISTSRLDAIDKLRDYGITVDNVYMPLDLVVNNRVGETYKLIEKNEEDARRLKETEWFGALDVEDPEERRQTIISRFRTFKQAYQVAGSPNPRNKQSLMGLPGINDKNIKQMQFLLTGNNARNKHLDEKRQDRVVQKADVREALNQLEGHIIFVDDSQQERAPYAERHQGDLVLRPPHAQGFSHEHEQCTMSCGSFVRTFAEEVNGFPPLDEEKLELLLELANADVEAGFLTEALFLYRIAYVVAAQLNLDRAPDIARSVRRVEEANLARDTFQNQAFPFANYYLSDDYVPDLPLPFGDYYLPDDYAPAIEHIQSYVCARREFSLALFNLRTAVPSAFKFGFWASIIRFFLGLDESKETIDGSMQRLSQAYENLSLHFPDSPVTQSYCLLEMEQCQRECAFSPLKSQLKAMTPTLAPDAYCIKEVLKDRIAHNSYATGLWGLTGVSHPPSERKIPQGVDALLNADDLDQMINSANQSSNRYSFLRARDTGELYQEVSNINSNSLQF